VPVFARVGLHQIAGLGLAQQAPPQHFDFQHQGLDVAGEHDVAAAPEHAQALGAPTGLAHQVGQQLGLAQPQQALCLRRDAKCVVRLQGRVVLD